MQKIVFNAHYMMYFDTAISDYWRSLAFPYEEGMHQLGGDLYVRKASVEYHGSARFDDRLDVALKCVRIGNSSIVFSGAIFRVGELLITGELVYVFADPISQTSRPVPNVLRQLLTDFESRRPVTRIETGTWTQLGADAGKIRLEVFVDEQHVPVEMEWDEADANAVHAVAYNALDQAVATGRLLKDASGTSRIGRMAVKRVLRGAQLGRDILHALMKASHERGDAGLMLHAQLTARDFYQREGFSVCGEPFDEAGIPHVEMTRPFAPA